MLGTADTTVADSDFPNFNPFIVGVADRVLAQAFAWQDGRLSDLGARPGNNSSAVRGQTTGVLRGWVRVWVFVR